MGRPTTKTPRPKRKERIYFLLTGVSVRIDQKEISTIKKNDFRRISGAVENLLAGRKLDVTHKWDRYPKDQQVGRYVEEKVENQMIVICITLSYINQSVALLT